MAKSKEIKLWIGVFVGSLILATGYVFFINPYNIVPGGVYGISIVLHNLFPTIQVGTFGYMFDIPLLCIAVYFLGARLGAKTLVASMTTPLLMNIITYLSYPTKDSMQSLDPAMLLGGIMDLSSNMMLTVVIGSVVIGIGCGIVVKSGATTGGTDIIGMLMQKYMHIRFSNAIMIADSTVVMFGLVVFFCLSKENQSPVYLSLYSFIAIFLISRVIARVLNGATNDKILFIISDQDLKTLHQFILKDLDRSATLIKSSGLYTGGDKELLFLVVSYKEVAAVKKVVKEVDSRAFVVVTDAYDTYGEGWKTLPNKDEIVAE